MRGRHCALSAATLVLLGLAFAMAPARAEIYGWVDATGHVTYSNMDPPAGVRVTEVIHEPPAPPPAVVAEADRAVQMRALNDRIRQLEFEVDRDRKQPTVVVSAQPVAAAPPFSGCEFDSFDCGPWWSTAPLFPVYGRSLHSHRDRGERHHVAPRPRTAAQPVRQAQWQARR